MIIPNLSPPVIRPQLFDPKPLLQLLVLGEKLDQHGNPVTDPSGKPILIYQYQTAPWAVADPNAPQRWLHPVACTDWCYLFSGFSLTSCLARCRR
jgi:hypothetical protein